MKFAVALSVLFFSFSSFAQTRESFDGNSFQEHSAIEAATIEETTTTNVIGEAATIGQTATTNAIDEAATVGETAAEQTSYADDSAAAQKSIEETYLVFKTSSQEIRMLETDADIFSASNSAQKNRALTSIANGELQRRFYDEEFRLFKIEYWRVASSSAQSTMRRLKTYSFGADGKLGEIRENDFEASTSAVSFFNADGTIRSSRKNSFTDGTLDSFDIFTYEYDGAGRVLQESRQVFRMHGKKQKRVLSQRVVNTYAGERLSETSFYENSVLRIRTVYTDDDQYVQTTYFDGGLAVRDFYENGRKVSSTLSNEKRSGTQ